MLLLGGLRITMTETTFTNLLAQTTQTPSTDTPQTLADTLRKHAKDLTDEDLTMLVGGLREQRKRWNAAQASGTKVTSKKAGVKPAQVNLSGFAIKKPTI
jgi:hypothetical protein